MNIVQAIIIFINQPFYEIAPTMLYIIGPFIVIGVLFTGFTEIWKDYKQGEYFDKLKWCLLSISVPQDAINTPMGMENFFNNLAGSKSAITWKEKWLQGKFQAFFSFEIFSDGGRVTFYMRCTDKYRDLVEAALYAQYPEAQILEVDDYTSDLPRDFPNEEYDLFGSELTLRKPSHFPLRTYEMFEHQGEKDMRFKDPLLPMLESMGKMRPGEKYMVQFVIMSPDEQDWRKGGEDYIKKMYGKDEAKKPGIVDEAVGWIPGEIYNQVTGFEGGNDARSKDDFLMFKITPVEKDLIDAVNKKISKLGWMVKIRFVYIAKKEVFRKGTIASMTKGIFHQYGYLGWNTLGFSGPNTTKDDYPWQAWDMPRKQRLIVSRYADRSLSTGSSPIHLNSEELATLFHFPAADARTPVLTTMGARRAEAPVELGLQGVGVPDMLNMERKSHTVQPVVDTTPQPMSVPHLTSPTGAIDRAETILAPQTSPDEQVLLDVHLPKVGMPAPLPPGLDISDTFINDTEVPNNLPL
ncbi:hypothetical protein COY25_03075 [Candidatus Uhrbacteria bacterium CG_4_10_14_0_2_um_filter_41_7]|uniref:DUF8128 domain-containing protein n=1 Tax=Candidatus Uhrbacteria bacterium CG_4_9_14_3_um_filter_41_35 TaxID=1975034 RepID=A0A2M7XDR2_9BACT|nr:MAG: hypothetical protein COV92_00965 [Candidatus Uhrbacteria bacterium CG11_big_fil_rev_8_21_14_0_20_41_9]PIZ53758.1 MAG: hypothetical protein COY25_03075 [Candidatus Uhrbacteria bacterium CG_4_10_14_0_2_um_filter_41_7]PJA46013.1 MAG: hypothetical protein CO173_04015 [Candidatus Uhrbacteria bacterium CG_4_9_14_3_um_filter_41_35]